MRHPHRRAHLDSVSCGLLFVRHHLSDLRCGDGVPLSLGGRDARDWTQGIRQSLYLLYHVGIGPVACLEEKSIDMGINIKSVPYEDFNDNEALEELNKRRNSVMMSTLDDLVNWRRSNSVWPFTFATSCCGIEMMATGAPRHDFARFGIEVYRASPRQADVIVVAGSIVRKMAPVLKRLYDQMADPKYVIPSADQPSARSPISEDGVMG